MKKTFRSLFISTWLLLWIAKSVSAASNKPNILFIAIDDCKPMIGCYGNTKIKTPHMDNVALQGVTFLNNHCQWAVCGPSRASLLSGLRPESNGVMNLKTKMRDSL